MIIFSKGLNEQARWQGQRAHDAAHGLGRCVTDPTSLRVNNQHPPQMPQESWLEGIEGNQLVFRHAGTCLHNIVPLASRN